jgi:hypothetical protein
MISPGDTQNSVEIGVRDKVSVKTLSGYNFTNNHLSAILDVYPLCSSLTKYMVPLVVDKIYNASVVVTPPL